MGTIKYLSLETRRFESELMYSSKQMLGKISTTQSSYLRPPISSIHLWTTFLSNCWKKMSLMSKIYSSWILNKSSRRSQVQPTAVLRQVLWHPCCVLFSQMEANQHFWNWEFSSLNAGFRPSLYHEAHTPSWQQPAGLRRHGSRTGHMISGPCTDSML